ncbi:MAG TPA: serine hydrolase domain-containing protein, partial [Thermomicrobiales bacterium]|nr:serine hydrolase domain-containing protein [Thermomicrobiales bacterium]
MEYEDRLRQVASGILDASGAPGAVVAVVIDGQLWTAGIGYATYEGTVPISPGARFGAYSITKTVIAAIVMRLVERGEMDLDAPIGRYMPGLVTGADVPLRLLLNHSGGFPDYGGIAAYRDDVQDHPESPWTTGEFLSRTMRDGMLFAPGEGWRYSNIAYMLLRLAIERVTVTPFHRVVRRETGLDTATSLADMAALAPG